MPTVSPIKQSPITKFLLENKYCILKSGDKYHQNICFLNDRSSYLGGMVLHSLGSAGIDVIKNIFNGRRKPIYRERIQIRNKMGFFWSKEGRNKDKHLPIASTTTREIIDVPSKTQTKTVIERVLVNEPKLIQDVFEESGTEAYELEGQVFKYKIKSIQEETKPYNPSTDNKNLFI